MTERGREGERERGMGGWRSVSEWCVTIAAAFLAVAIAAVALGSGVAAAVGAGGGGAVVVVHIARPVPPVAVVIPKQHVVAAAAAAAGTTCHAALDGARLAKSARCIDDFIVEDDDNVACVRACVCVKRTAKPPHVWLQINAQKWRRGGRERERERAGEREREREEKEEEEEERLGGGGRKGHCERGRTAR